MKNLMNLNFEKLEKIYDGEGYITIEKLYLNNNYIELKAINNEFNYYIKLFVNDEIEIDEYIFVTHFNYEYENQPIEDEIDKNVYNKIFEIFKNKDQENLNEIIEEIDEKLIEIINAY